MRLLLTCLFTLTFLSLAAQRAQEYVDVVSLKGGEEVRGTLVEYRYGEGVKIMDERGNLRSLLWDDIKHTKFQLDNARRWELRNRAEDAAVSEQVAASPDSLTLRAPQRNWRHQVTGALNFGRASSDFGFNPHTLGGGFAYHYLRKVRALHLGLGADLTMLSDARSEYSVSITALAELPLGLRSKKLRPVLRLEGGASLPIGDLRSQESVVKRFVGTMLHPALGVQIHPKTESWGYLVVDVGYRFQTGRFRVITDTLDEFERRVNYRRLVLRAGLRF